MWLAHLIACTASSLVTAIVCFSTRGHLLQHAIALYQLVGAPRRGELEESCSASTCCAQNFGGVALVPNERT